jgi:type II secretory ATPase GspE/PulE/Tfp pilus assembly ATPase PilB-like protein
MLDQPGANAAPVCPQAPPDDPVCRAYPAAQHPQALKDLLRAQASRPVQHLGHTLLSLGLISPAERDEATKPTADGASQPWGARLVEQGRISPEQLELALNLQLGYVRVDAQHFPIEPQACSRVPMPLLQRLNVLPLMHWDGQLLVAMADPKRQGDLDELAWASECRVRPAVAEAAAIRQRLQAIAQGRDGPGLQAAAAEASGLAERWLAHAQAQTAAGWADAWAEADPAQPDEADSGLVQWVHQMIIDAHTQGASDIHVEAQAGRDTVRIRFRLDGRLQPYRELPHTLRAALVSRLKVMCSLDIAERRKPQDGKMAFGRYCPEHPLELRMVTIPTVQGLEDVVLRLLTATQAMTLEQLGLHPQTLSRFTSVVNRPHGLILCAGPTGSGKSTTLHAALAHLNTPERKIWTAEDPVELTQPGLRQVQINPRIDWTFGQALRAFLRADPDVIMVGEVRDRDTARTAVEAALTGHLVLSTIHTNSAAETVTRLLDMGLDPFHLGDALLAVMGQRLVRRLCPQCRQSRPAAAGLVSWQAPGCAHCQQGGLRGRIGLHELLVVSPDIRGLIQARQPSSALQACALEQGMVSLRQDGVEKVSQGWTTLEEVRAACPA